MVMEIRREQERLLIRRRLAQFPVVAILGPRQCGKTTLSRQYAKNCSVPVHYFDLENARDLAKLENPLMALEELRGLIIIDEIQRRPGLFPTLRVLIDAQPKTRYLILGSASRDLIQQSSETLAGRISYFEIGGFTMEHLPAARMKSLWLRGGFPRSFLAKNDPMSFEWREEFITTFLERDIPNLGIDIPPHSLRRFWTMLSHCHGQIFNASDIGRSFGVSDVTARRYLDVLSGTFLVRQLQPWFYNTKKRLVKRPKIYFRDSGIFHTFLSIQDEKNLLSHPKLGASWEGFILEQAIGHLNLREGEVFFWSTHAGSELDMVFQRHGKLWGVEMKYADARGLTASMRAAVNELSLAHLWVIYPGKTVYALDKKTSVVPADSLIKIINP